MNFFLKSGLLLTVVLTAISCKESEPKETIPQNSEKEQLIDLNSMVKCNDYILSEYENMFTTSYDYGCIYSPGNGNDFGNVITYMVPKDFHFFNKYSKDIAMGNNENMEKYVNSLNVDQCKEIFDIYVFLIDKKYLNHTPKLDSPYNVKPVYQTDLYQYKNNSWVKIDSFSVTSDEKEKEEMLWRINTMEMKSKSKRTAFFNSISKSKIDESWYRDYILLLESYEPSYNYAYYIKMAKDSSYIRERALHDLLIPFQNKDTLFLYHKKGLFEEYNKCKMIPEVTIVRIKDKYFINSVTFDLKNSISNKPTKYGFLVDEEIN